MPALAFSSAGCRRFIITDSVFWLLVGAAATIYLLVKKQLYTPKNQVAPNPEAPTFGQCMGAFFGTPGMIVSFIPLVVLTIFSIQKL